MANQSPQRRPRDVEYVSAATTMMTSVTLNQRFRRGRSDLVIVSAPNHASYWVPCLCCTASELWRRPIAAGNFCSFAIELWRYRGTAQHGGSMAVRTDPVVADAR